MSKFIFLSALGGALFAEGTSEHSAMQVDFGLSTLTTIFVLLLVIIIVWLALNYNKSFSDEDGGHHEDGHDDHGHAEHGHDTHGDHGDKHAEVVVVETTPEPEPVEPEAPAQPAAPAKPDDLKKIEGIGPKVSMLLREAGIATFAELAAADIARLNEILDANKLQMMDPASWPEQARLAAAGDWEALEKLQDSLKGGRAE